MPKINDLTGRRFGRLVVKSIHDKKHGQFRWLCKCDCGNETIKYKHYLMDDNGIIKSCGCVYLDELKTHIGERKDYLEIVDAVRFGKSARVVVKCDCGKEKIIQLSQFKNPAVHSCGCKGVKRGNQHSKYKHGLSRTRIYGVYRDMYNRCYNPKDISYKCYGKLGIKICDNWLGDNGFLEFRKWAIETGYDEKAKRGDCTIDRIDVNGNYCPENCRWAGAIEQGNNKKNNNVIEIDGEFKTLSEWCRIYGVKNVQSVDKRLKNGMDAKTALSKPMLKRYYDMTEEELLERKRKALERDRKWRSEHKEQVQASRQKWIENNPEKVIETRKRYEEKQKKKP